jgi:hypothetical protein
VCELRLLLKLEHLAHFSFEDPSGLIQIAKHVGHTDSARKVEDFLETRRRAASTTSSAKPAVKIKMPIEERQHLKDVHDAIASKCTALEKGFQETWKGETVTKQEGLRRKVEDGVDVMLNELKKCVNSLFSFFLTTATFVSETVLKRDRGMPKLKPMRRSVEQELTYNNVNTAIKEFTCHKGLLFSSRLTMNVKQQAHDPPRKDMNIEFKVLIINSAQY